MARGRGRGGSRGGAGSRGRGGGRAQRQDKGKSLGSDRPQSTGGKDGDMMHDEVDRYYQQKEKLSLNVADDNAADGSGEDSAFDEDAAVYDVSDADESSDDDDALDEDIERGGRIGQSMLCIICIPVCICNFFFRPPPPHSTKFHTKSTQGILFV